MIVRLEIDKMSGAFSEQKVHVEVERHYSNAVGRDQLVELVEKALKVVNA